MQCFQSAISQYKNQQVTMRKNWFFTDPAIVLDQETDEEFMIVDLEWGWLNKSPGHSWYIRPAFGVGSDRRTDGSIEIGYKIVGF